MLNIKNLRIQNFKKGLKYILIIGSITMGILAIKESKESATIEELKTQIATATNLDTEIKNDLYDYIEVREEYKNNPTIENRMKVIKEGKELEEVYESMIANDLSVERVELDRDKDGIAKMDVYNEKDNKQFTDSEIPKDILNATSHIESVYSYNGGENWNNQDMKNYTKSADDLFEAIINQSNYDYEIEDEKITQTKR